MHNLWSKPLSHHISISSPSRLRWCCCSGAYFSVLHSVFRFHVRTWPSETLSSISKHPDFRQHHVDTVAKHFKAHRPPQLVVAATGLHFGCVAGGQPLATSKRAYSKNAGRTQLQTHTAADMSGHILALALATAEPDTFVLHGLRHMGLWSGMTLRVFPRGTTNN